MTESDIQSVLRGMAGQIGGLESTVRSLVETWRTQETAASESRRSLYVKFDAVQSEVHQFGTRLDGALRDIADMKPTVAEVEAAKQRVIGAGLLGRALWLAGGALITAGLWFLAHIPAR